MCESNLMGSICYLTNILIDLKKIYLYHLILPDSNALGEGQLGKQQNRTPIHVGNKSLQK